MIDFDFFDRLTNYKNLLEESRQEYKIKLYLKLRLLYYLKKYLCKKKIENEYLCNWDFTMENYGIDLDSYDNKEKLRLDLKIAKRKIKIEKYNKKLNKKREEEEKEEYFKMEEKNKKMNELIREQAGKNNITTDEDMNNLIRATTTRTPLPNKKNESSNNDNVKFEVDLTKLDKQIEDEVRKMFRGNNNE